MSETNGLLPGNWMRSSSIILNVTFVAFIGYILYRIIIFIVWFHNLCSVFNKFPKDCREDVKIDFILNLGRKYPKYFRLWRGPFYLTIIAHHPDAVRKILKTSEPKPTGFSGSYGFLLPWLGSGLLIAKGSQWARSNRLLTPAFHFDILKPYIAIYNDAANELIEKLAAVVDTEKPFEVFQAISLCTLDVIMRCAFSYHNDCQRQKETHPYVQAVNAIADTVEYRSRNPILYPDFIFYLTKSGREFSKYCKFVHNVAECVINRRRKTLGKECVSSRKFLDLVDILLTAKDETGVGLTPLEIRNEVDTFMFEGHDMSCSAISWILYSLAEHIYAQDKVRAEVDTVLEGRQTNDLRWNCIGQNFAMNEMKVVLAKLVHRYKFELEPNHAPRKIASLVMRAANGVLLSVSSR